MAAEGSPWGSDGLSAVQLCDERPPKLSRHEQADRPAGLSPSCQPLASSAFLRILDDLKFLSPLYPRWVQADALADIEHVATKGLTWAR